MLYYKDILEKNKKWAAKKLAENPTYFDEMAKGQHPPLLWIGCADSRVPSSDVIGAEPGEVFTHRDIANDMGISMNNTCNLDEIYHIHA